MGVVLAFFLLGPTMPFASRTGPGSAFLPVLVFAANLPALLYLWRTLAALPPEPAGEVTDEAALAAFGETTGMSARELDVVRLVVMAWTIAASGTSCSFHRRR